MDIKDAMLQYAPELAEDYAKFTRDTFAAMQDDLGSDLKGVYSSSRWARMFAGIRGNLDQNISQGRIVSYQINDQELSKNAKNYGERISLEWFCKIREKLGDLDNVSASRPSGSGDVTVTGKHGDDIVRIEQQRAINVSPLGTLFHQFPSRIYVNDKIIGEAAYKGKKRDWRVSEIVRPQKSKKPPIDPDSRPKKYKFEFLRDHSGAYGGRTDKNVPGCDSAKGMSATEAWLKIYRPSMKSGYYSRIHDVRIVAIRSWNGTPIWKAGSDTERPIDDFDWQGTLRDAEAAKEATKLAKKAANKSRSRIVTGPKSRPKSQPKSQPHRSSGGGLSIGTTGGR